VEQNRDPAASLMPSTILVASEATTVVARVILAHRPPLLWTRFLAEAVRGRASMSLTSARSTSSTVAVLSVSMPRQTAPCRRRSSCVAGPTMVLLLSRHVTSANFVRPVDVGASGLTC